LQFITPESGQRPLAILRDQMRADALLVVLRRAGFPLAAVEIEVRAFNERAEQRYFSGLPRLPD